jgi:hypothetical protein
MITLQQFLQSSPAVIRRYRNESDRRRILEYVCVWTLAAGLLSQSTGLCLWYTGDADFLPSTAYSYGAAFSVMGLPLMTFSLASVFRHENEFHLGSLVHQLLCMIILGWSTWCLWGTTCFGCRLIGQFHVNGLLLSAIALLARVALLRSRQRLPFLA